MSYKLFLLLGGITLKAIEMERILKSFDWNIIRKMYGNSHSSIIGFILSQWIMQSEENSVLDGVPSPVVGKGRKGQRNADILLCKKDKPFAVVEVESQVSKYIEKINSIQEYLNNAVDYEGLQFGMLIMLNYTKGKRKYKHNWDKIRNNLQKIDHPIIFISVAKEKVKLSDTILDNLKKRNDYYPWEISDIEYIIVENKEEISIGKLFSSESNNIVNNSNITNEYIEYVIKNMNMPQFTVLDFGKFIQENDRDLWDMLTNKYANKNYSAYSYLSHRLIRYSKEKDSLLEKHIPYRISDECFRKPTKEEKKHFKSDNIVVFKVKS